jgi:hypothetical protein
VTTRIQAAELCVDHEQPSSVLTSNRRRPPREGLSACVGDTANVHGAGSCVIVNR